MDFLPEEDKKQSGLQRSSVIAMPDAREPPNRAESSGAYWYRLTAFIESHLLLLGEIEAFSGL
jgi:hypothetical protein